MQTEELLDKLSISLTGEELEVIGKLYHQGMKLEIDFFTAQPIVQRTVVPLAGVLAPAEQRLVLFSDFDLTCTVVDSSAILAEIAIVIVPKGDPDVPGTPHSRKSSADLRNTWNALSRQYTEEYEQCIETIMPTEKGNCIIVSNVIVICIQRSCQELLLNPHYWKKKGIYGRIEKRELDRI